MTPEELEKLPKPLERTMTALEMSVMSEIVQRIKESSQITPVTDWMLNRLAAIGESKSRIKKLIADALKESDLKIDDIYDQAVQPGYIRNKEVYEASGMDYLPYEDNQWLQQVVDASRRQTKDILRTFENITQTTGFNVMMGNKRVFTPLSEYLERSLDKAMIGITTGMKTYSQAIGDVIDEMTSSGIRTVDYVSGKSDRIEVAARRAVMTGVAQMTDKVNEKNAEELQTDYWEVDWHMGARNTGTGYKNHQSWQGKVYSSEEMRTVCGLGEMLGFAGINCYHIRFPFIPGVSKRKYTDEWLEEQNRKENERNTYRGKEYDTYGALQHQRKLERTIRKQKQDVELLQKAGSDPDDITAAKSRLRLTNKAYVDFSKAMGLRQQRERLRIGKVRPAGLKAFGSGGSVPEHPAPQYIEKIDISVREHVQSVLGGYETLLSKEDIENAIVITKDGEVIRCFGDKNGVYPDVDLGEKLYGAYVTHNHPPGSANEYSFSDADIRLFRGYELEMLRGIDEKYIYEVNKNSRETDEHCASIFDLTDEDGRHESVIDIAQKYGFGYRRWSR